MGNCCVFQPATGAPDAVRWLKSNLLRLKQLFPSLMKQNKHFMTKKLAKSCLVFKK